MTISKGDFESLIIELVTKNPTMGIPPLEDGSFCEVVDFQFMDGTWAELGLNSKDVENKDVENEDHNMRILLRKN